VESASFDVRVFGVHPDRQTYLVQAETPVEAAIEVFFRIYEATPSVVELGRSTKHGLPVTSVRLAAGPEAKVVEIEVHRLPDQA
jgi:hypothetical protein